MHYTHLSLEERERMYALREQGYSFRDIGKLLKRHHTTLSREYRRNAPYIDGEYIPVRAHNRAQERGRRQRLKAPLKSPEILVLVREQLRGGMSPESISGRLMLEKGLHIHHETIYRYIYHKDNRKYQLWNYLKYKRKRRQKQNGRAARRANRIKNAVSIEERPTDVELREEYGHWETDLMEGPKGTRPALLVNIERKFRYVKLAKIPSKNAKSTTGNMIRLLKRFKPLSITSDNGLENAHHEEIAERLKCKFYFCHPYSSWEKGSVENRIGVIRMFIPKGVDISKYSHKDIQKIEDAINNRPMKCLGWHTPAEMMRKEGRL